jgi:hypothetical protein
MCRNITELRGLEPPATRVEIEAAALQFLRKVTGTTRITAQNHDVLHGAVDEIAAITERVLSELPPRRTPPRTVPPLRRPEVRQRLGLDRIPGRVAP